MKHDLLPPFSSRNPLFTPYSEYQILTNAIILFTKNCLLFHIIFQIAHLNRSFHSVTNLHTILRYSCFQSIQHCLFFFLFLFISNTIQWKTQFNLNKVCFFIHAKSSLYNRLLDIAKTAFQKQLTSKSTVFWKVVSSDSYSNPANNLINNCPSRKYALRPVWYWSVTSSPKRSTIVFIRLLSHRKSSRTFSPENIEITSFVKFSSQRASWQTGSCIIIYLYLFLKK